MARVLQLMLFVFAILIAYLVADCVQHQRCLSKDIVIDTPNGTIQGPVVIRTEDCH